MTKTMINFMDKKPVSRIEKGTIVKKSGDMFIVAKISEAQFTNAVDQALFSNDYNKTYASTTGGTIGTRHSSHAYRNPEEPKYVLISFSTGMKFYPEFLPLPELLMRMTRAGFEVVEKVEIKETH